MGLSTHAPRHSKLWHQADEISEDKGYNVSVRPSGGIALYPKGGGRKDLKTVPTVGEAIQYMRRHPNTRMYPGSHNPRRRRSKRRRSIRRGIRRSVKRNSKRRTKMIRGRRRYGKRRR